ncbi:hypothetical protein SAY86_022871 [Trapa natans]|uniref:Receptor-like serine/threonine-protein kinase n=1 Tax=Trapa natans TaxID=22666 RepID=A0AAN7R9N3_TRANT|nr:hypothetical protein SAY86_022871 [Trapa natans]
MRPPTMFRSLFLCFPFLLFILNASSFLFLIDAAGSPYDYPTAGLSTVWNNSATANHSAVLIDGSTVRVVLLRGSLQALGYGCGFYCTAPCEDYLFAIFIVRTNIKDDSYTNILGTVQVAWHANRKSPIKINSSLELTSGGDLVLKDADGTVSWSTNTTGKGVVGMNITEGGNLVLFDEENGTVWQSFDHPTDTLLLGQKLSVGQTLIPNVPSKNLNGFDLVRFELTKSCLLGFMDTDPRQVYYQKYYSQEQLFPSSVYAEYLNGSLVLFGNSTPNSTLFTFPSAMPAQQFMRLGSDGHLRVFQWNPESSEWGQVADLLHEFLQDCDYPIACGEYGICSGGQCTCPDPYNGTAYFRQVSDRHPALGCSVITPLSCSHTQNQTMIELLDVFYFAINKDIQNTSAESCKQVCQSNCSCKAAFFQYESMSPFGDCYFASRVFTLTNIEPQKTPFIKYTAFLKVQNAGGSTLGSSPVPNPSTTHKRSRKLPVVIGSIAGALFALVLVVGVIGRKTRGVDEEEETYLDQVPGMPTRFSFEEIKGATASFSKKLGEGGFGSVFEGILLDGTKIAVKQLEGFYQIKKLFLAEIETIGSIHHVNLVRLVGFCADKTNRFLVYEFMTNGSLDRWIYHKNRECVLEWRQRKKIILDIAKGLNYLHEECRHKIIHLDIKPQNILLDENFNAKVSDFGLSKLIDRDQSQIVTTMRGTPGYLAPEWLSAAITEKADVYSFGIVILEIVCGRRVFDSSLNEEDMHLPSLLKRKAREERLLEIVDKNGEDMQLHGPEAVGMMMVAAWCLQGDLGKRPSMSAVVKALEGVNDIIMEVELDDIFINPVPPRANASVEIGKKESDSCFTDPQLPSVLSGPR